LDVLVGCLKLRQVAVIYTGGRGFHVWVFDPVTRKYSSAVLHDVIQLLHQRPDRQLLASAAERLVTCGWVFGEDPLDAVASTVIFDSQVTMTDRHPLRLPFSLNSSGNIAIPIPPEMLDCDMPPTVAARDVVAKHPGALSLFRFCLSSFVQTTREHAT
jgi:DNA primase catalytic subunit